MSNYNIQYKLQLTDGLLNLKTTANSEEEARDAGQNMLIELLASSPIDDFGLSVNFVSITEEIPKYTPLAPQLQQANPIANGYTSMASLCRGTPAGYSRLT